MIEFKVPAMSCSHCEIAVTEAVLSVDPQARIKVDLDAKEVKIDSAADRLQLVRALTTAGYPPV